MERWSRDPPTIYSAMYKHIYPVIVYLTLAWCSFCCYSAGVVGLLDPLYFGVFNSTKSNNFMLKYSTDVYFIPIRSNINSKYGPLSPWAMSRTTLIPWFFSGRPPSGFPVYTCKFQAYEEVASQAAQIFIPYLAGLNGICLKGQCAHTHTHTHTHAHTHTDLQHTHAHTHTLTTHTHTHTYSRPRHEEDRLKVHRTYNFYTFISPGSSGPEHHVCNMNV